MSATIPSKALIPANIPKPRSIRKRQHCVTFGRFVLAYGAQMRFYSHLEYATRSFSVGLRFSGVRCFSGGFSEAAGNVLGGCRGWRRDADRYTCRRIGAD